MIIGTHAGGKAGGEQAMEVVTSCARDGRRGSCEYSLWGLLATAHLK